MKYQIHCYNLFCFLLQPYYDILYSVNKHPSHLYFFIHYVYCLKIGINYICVYKLAKKCYIFKLYFSVLITTYTFLSFCCHFVILFGCCLFLFLFILYYIIYTILNKGRIIHQKSCATADRISIVAIWGVNNSGTGDQFWKVF